MPQATFRFYAELNDFLPADTLQNRFPVTFSGHETVKHILETMGVPHTEVDLILVNGESVGFDRQIEEGDRVSVFPVFESLDISRLTEVRPEPLREPKFVLDNHLGKLAGYLRLLGFDTRYENDYQDPQLAKISQEEDRILLTRDRGLLKRKVVSHGYCVREDNPQDQIIEILRRFDLAPLAQPYSRCARCNGYLQPAEKEEIVHHLEPLTKEYYDDFMQCEHCGQVYWRGSHFEDLNEFLNHVVKEADRSSHEKK